MTKEQTFRNAIKKALLQIYQDEEGSMLAIHIDQPQIQDLIEETQDENPTLDCRQIIKDEIDNFQPNF
jgi:hypothetical protein